jgi:hypothetical protein
MVTRHAVVAGQFYAGSKKLLLEEVEKCFLDKKRGPGKLPSIQKNKEKLLGVVVPHAGYMFSGAIAAHSYNKIAETGFADSFIILGPNHTGYGSAIAAMIKGIWETPLGEVKINENLGKNICKGIIDNDETAHRYEHSIEVQLPFLQYIDNDFDFVPICLAMQDYETSLEIGEIISNTIKQTGKKIVIVASTDFSHVGFSYSNMPPRDIRVDEYAKKQDQLAIDKILKLDPKGLINVVYEHNISMCGYGAVASMLVAAKKLGAKKAELLKYGTSYEVHPSTSCVGYGAIAVFR